MNEALVSDVTEEEIHAALLKIHPNKALGPDGMTSKVDEFFEEIAQVNQMELRSCKKLPSVPNYGKNLVQELSQSKNRSSPNPKSPVQDHDRGAVGALSSQNEVTQQGRSRMLAGQTLAANGQHVRYDILVHLTKDSCTPQRIRCIEDVCRLRMSLVYALTNPEEFSNEVNQVKMRSSEPTYAECLALITFTDDYLQPGLIKHNRPLFISGYLNGLGITRIMIDGGSAVNLLPLRILKHLGIAIHQLGPSNLLIQGFNQNGEQKRVKANANPFSEAKAKQGEEALITQAQAFTFLVIDQRLGANVGSAQGPTYLV
ncbi:hypothetical protein ES319_A13G098400v1 [Gossypium barbadense]|uniref:Retrotransposon gag domain-containing protein n=1 Tax=Gossypium barbadense TaxID=3634 RepID=A0A5J5SXK6_GOSBA|nr:hypothetical protein ES319_A13G098400v1 [Gossypium barbadense]